MAAPNSKLKERIRELERDLAQAERDLIDMQALHAGLPKPSSLPAFRFEGNSLHLPSKAPLSALEKVLPIVDWDEVDP